MKNFILYQKRGCGEYLILPDDVKCGWHIVTEGPCVYLSMLRLKRLIEHHYYDRDSTWAASVWTPEREAHTNSTVSFMRRKLDRLCQQYPEYCI
jgi:hypothetical protein